MSSVLLAFLMRNTFQKSVVSRDLNISKKQEIILRYVIKGTERRCSWKNISTYILYKIFGIFNVGKRKIFFLSDLFKIQFKNRSHMLKKKTNSSRQ